MPRATPALPIEQTDQQQLQQWASAFGTPPQVAMHSQIVLAAAADEKSQIQALDHTLSYI